MDKLECTNPDCQVATTGKCFEGLPPEECPHCNKLSANAKTAELTSATIDEFPISTEMTVHSGNILDTEEAANVLCQARSTVICLLGSVDAGKTTLCLGLYNAFQNGPFDKWVFHHSLTLPEFELRSHHSRIECGNLVPETNRTPVSDGLGFFHLTVRNKINCEKNQILISERSGEFYRDVANSVEKCDSIHELTRADYTLYLVDGKKLANNETRHVEKAEVMMLLVTLVQNEVIGKRHRVGLVLTKYDIVVSNEIKDQIEADFNALVASVKSRCGEKLHSVDSFKIAARSMHNSVEQMHGMSDLLETCLQPLPCVSA